MNKIIKETISTLGEGIKSEITNENNTKKQVNNSSFFGKSLNPEQNTFIGPSAGNSMKPNNYPF